MVHEVTAHLNTDIWDSYRRVEMRSELRIPLLLLCIALATPSALGDMVIYGGSGNKAYDGTGFADGGAYFDLDSTGPLDGSYYVEYGIFAQAETNNGPGKAESHWTNSELYWDTPVVKNNLLLGDDDVYEITVSYGANGGVEAFADQESDTGSIFAESWIWAYGEADNTFTLTGLPDFRSVYGETGIYSRAYNDNAEGIGYAKAEATAAGYNVERLGTSQAAFEVEEAWGAVSGKTEASAINTAEKDGSIYSEAGIYANSYAEKDRTYFMGGYWDDIYSDAYSDIYASTWATNLIDKGEATGYAFADGVAQSGAWDATTPVGTMKMNGNNENVYSKVSGAIDPIVEADRENDYAYAAGSVWSYAENEKWTTGPFLQYSYAEGDANTYAEVYREGAPNDDKLVKAESYLNDASMSAVSRSAGTEVSTKASDMWLASGTGSLNPTDSLGWYTDADFYTWAEYDSSDPNEMFETETNYYTEVEGPQFFLSGSEFDYAGSWNDIGSFEVKSQKGGEYYKQSADDHAFRTVHWISGVDLGVNMYQNSFDYDVETTAVGGQLNEDIGKYFDQSMGDYRYSEAWADIEYDSW